MAAMGKCSNVGWWPGVRIKVQALKAAVQTPAEHSNCNFGAPWPSAVRYDAQLMQRAYGARSRKGATMTTWGIIMLIVGIAGLIIGRVTQLSRRVSADRGSVAIGGDNNAPITVTTHGVAGDSGGSLFWIVWNIANGLASFIGLALALWPPHS